MKTLNLCAVATFAALSASTGLRAEPLLDEVIVTATRSDRALAQVPVSASVVSTTAIQDTPSQYLDDVLRHVPGMNLPIQTGSQAHPTAENVSMRGLGGIHALVLLDGVPVNDPYFGYVQWGRIPLETVERVEIVRGGGSPLWGNFAMGGVVNVITRDAQQDEAIANVGAGSYGSYRASLYNSTALGERNRISFTAETDGTNGFMAIPLYARSRFDVPTSFEARNIDLRDRWQVEDDLVVTGRLTYHRNTQQLGTRLSTNQQDSYAYTATAQKSFGSGAVLTASAFHTNSTFVTSNPVVNDPSLSLNTQTEHTDNLHTTPFHNTGGSLIWQRSFGSLVRNVTVGVDYNDVTGTDRSAIFDATGVTQIRTDIGSGEERFLGLFAEASLVPVAGAEILASGRVQRFDVLNGFDGNPGGGGVQPDKHYTSADPRLSARYALTDTVAIRGAYYEAFRAPTLDNLYRGFASSGGIYYPNAQLEPERLHGGELGVDYVAEDLRIQVTAYRTTIRNLIATRTLSYAELPPGFFYGGILVNAAAADARGVETEVTWRLGAGFSAQLGYTWAQSLYSANPVDPQSVGKQLQDVPRSTLSGALSYQGQRGWRAAVDARYVSTSSWASADHTDPGYPNQAAADPHLVIDLSGSLPVTDRLEAYAQLQNLLNRNYIVNPGPYNPPQRGTPFSLFVGARIRLQ